MIRFCIILALSGSAYVSLAGCKRAVSIDPDDKDILEKLAPFKPVHTTDNNGYVDGLKLEGPHVTDEVMDHVAKLRDLKTLSLFGSSISDKGLGKVRSLEKLETLGIGNTKITDKGLSALHMTKTLRGIWLAEKRISRKAVDELKKANPALVVYFQ